MIGVIDTGRGNLLSVCNAFDYLGIDAQLCLQPEDLDQVERIVLPGVGAFRDGMTTLNSRGFPEALARARQAGVPILGVCLGMQLLARCSEEGGNIPGLGWFDADVVRLRPQGYRVPHVGWNETIVPRPSPLFAGLPAMAEMYYVHSYQVVCDDPDDIDAVCEYGVTVTAAIRRDNVAAVQFHPEKSHDLGLQILDNFASWDV